MTIIEVILGCASWTLKPISEAEAQKLESLRTAPYSP